ncbi:RPA-interacting protein isoform X2 [Rattus norvegicus]|uniref:RPA-interacting protein isoform X2 n=1 Tax=Rattus norvegicus TaxID=10116 RepID=UPI001916CD4E|nr:RPA-interacting protein isoform X2 [Rattus norvegicus]
MAESSGSPHRLLYKQVGSPPWKETFRQGCLERMRNSRHKLLNRYNLRIMNSVVTCPCGLHIPSHSTDLTEQKLRACLEGNVNEHSAHCPHIPEFSVTGGTEEKPSLLMSCLACDTWAVIL